MKSRIVLLAIVVVLCPVRDLLSAQWGGPIRGDESSPTGSTASCQRLDSAMGESLLCVNVWVAPKLADAFEAAVERSPTLRRLLTTAQHRHDLRVSVALVGRCNASSQKCRARTLFRRYGTRWSLAAIELQQGPEIAASLAHELEHVRQWLSGHLRSATYTSHHLEEEADAASHGVTREIQQWHLLARGPRDRDGGVRLKGIVPPTTERQNRQSKKSS